ncbi:MAG: cyclic peptide export ABC transporter, partial [Chamaesiphon sp.]|nr:cyclic peptide export ABC transporter [Chamaesiphon sp.]
RQATHNYQLAGQENTFTLGPVDLTLYPGELVFIVGGNGSGKSTLAKLITGLYVPDAGEILLDGTLVDDRNRELYRQLFSTVFADFYLFERLLGLGLQDLDAQAKTYLEQLQLTHKVTIENGKLSTTALSQGQRKRLALLTAYLEDRPIYLFDEWAADQDTFFREIFYQQLLPELKQRGKAVLVISHDDRYFHLADRLLKLDYGQIVDS